MSGLQQLAGNTAGGRPAHCLPPVSSQILVRQHVLMFWGLLLAGAYGCTISGAGPTCVAVVGCPEDGQRVAQAMQDAFIHSGKLQVNSMHVTELDRVGTTLVNG